MGRKGLRACQPWDGYLFSPSFTSLGLNESALDCLQQTRWEKSVKKCSHDKGALLICYWETRHKAVTCDAQNSHRDFCPMLQPYCKFLYNTCWFNVCPLCSYEDASKLFEGLDSRAGVGWFFLRVDFFFIAVCLQMDLEFG